MIKELSPSEFVARRAAGADMTLVDVREDWEVKLAPAPTEFCIYDGQIAERIGELDPAKDTVVICRSGDAARKLRAFSISTALCQLPI